MFACVALCLGGMFFPSYALESHPDSQQIDVNEVISLGEWISNEEAEETLAQAFQNVRAGGSKTINDSDAVAYVSAYTTISWSETTVNNREMVYLTSISGGYTAQGTGAYIASGVSVISQSICVGQNGFTLGGYLEQSFDDNIDPATRSFSYSSSSFSNWLPVAANDTTNMGINYVITLKRGTSTSTWNCEINNTY